VLHLSQREAIEAWESSFAYADSIFALLTLEQAVDKVKDPISIDGSNRIVISAPDGFAANVGAQIEMMIDNSEWQDADKKIEPKQARVTTPEPLPRGSRELRFELKRALKREKKETTHKSRLSRAMAKYKNRLSPATMEPKRLANFLSPASPVNGGAEAIMIPDDDVGTATADGLEDNREDIPSGRAPTSLEEVFSKEKKNEFDSSSSLSLDGMDTKEQPLEQKLPKSFQPRMTASTSKVMVTMIRLSPVTATMSNTTLPPKNQRVRPKSRRKARRRTRTRSARSKESERAQRLLVPKRLLQSRNASRSRVLRRRLRKSLLQLPMRRL
jgi:hypothetical protein